MPCLAFANEAEERGIVDLKRSGRFDARPTGIYTSILERNRKSVRSSWDFIYNEDRKSIYRMPCEGTL